MSMINMIGIGVHIRANLHQGGSVEGISATAGADISNGVMRIQALDGKTQHLIPEYSVLFVTVLPAK